MTHRPARGAGRPPRNRNWAAALAALCLVPAAAGCAPAALGNVEGTDGGNIDRVSLLAVNDIQDFWSRTNPQFFPGQYAPIASIRSYDSTNPSSGRVCGKTVIYSDANASYCRHDDSISWDRGALIPNARGYFGDAAVAGVLAHEFGHAIQNRAHTVHLMTRTIVREQQADCFADVYLCVAQGTTFMCDATVDGALRHVAVVVSDDNGTYDGDGPR
jgi:predicted metalloprotease